jgi:hypothetical protein
MGIVKSHSGYPKRIITLQRYATHKFNNELFKKNIYVCQNSKWLMISISCNGHINGSIKKLVTIQ